MKKIIRLTETDLTKLLRKIILESIDTQWTLNQTYKANVIDVNRQNKHIEFEILSIVPQEKISQDNSYANKKSWKTHYKVRVYSNGIGIPEESLALIYVPDKFGESVYIQRPSNRGGSQLEITDAEPIKYHSKHPLRILQKAKEMNTPLYKKDSNIEQ